MNWSGMRRSTQHQGMDIKGTPFRGQQLLLFSRYKPMENTFFNQAFRDRDGKIVMACQTPIIVTDCS
jgi:hypothetical protein